jgi:transposase
MAKTERKVSCFPSDWMTGSMKIIRCVRSTCSLRNWIWGAWASSGRSLLRQGARAYHPATLLKIYIYGYLNRVQSSRRLEREAQRNVELIWLTGRLMPDFKTIADFRKDNGEAIRNACREFVLLCRGLGLFKQAAVAIDGSKFKAVNNRDKNLPIARSQQGCSNWTTA